MPTAFVIAPFDEPYTSYWQEVYEPALRRAGLQPHRADSMFRAGNVVQQIFERIAEADIVLAELTLHNANVYYELGVAHMLRRPCVLLTQNPEKIPFDLRSQRHVVYDPTRPRWDDLLQDDIVRAVRETLDNPATTTLPLPTPVTTNGATPGGTEVTARLEMIQSSVDRLRHDLVMPPPDASSDVPLGTAGELRHDARRLLDAGWPVDTVIIQLRARGAPHLWADAVVRELVEQKDDRPT
jgi:hypothetical protein